MSLGKAKYRGRQNRLLGARRDLNHGQMVARMTTSSVQTSNANALPSHTRSFASTTSGCCTSQRRGFLLTVAMRTHWPRSCRRPMCFNPLIVLLTDEPGLTGPASPHTYRFNPLIVLLTDEPGLTGPVLSDEIACLGHVRSLPCRLVDDKRITLDPFDIIQKISVYCIFFDLTR